MSAVTKTKGLLPAVPNSKTIATEPVCEFDIVPISQVITGPVGKTGNISEQIELLSTLS